ncbi:MAG TPA: hypothetical protein PKA88_07640 [Polyangiaceae bacterium]|nr:hypothetical protein [Polyangiaceae bacterium]
MRVLGVLFVVLAVGCGGSDGSGVGGPGVGSGGFGAATGGSGGSGASLALDAGGGLDAAPDAKGVGGAPAYPAGPYGNQVGSVLPNLEMLGYVRHDTTGLASEATLETVDFADLRAGAPKGLALIHISGFT